MCSSVELLDSPKSITARPWPRIFSSQNWTGLGPVSQKSSIACRFRSDLHNVAGMADVSVLKKKVAGDAGAASFRVYFSIS